MANRQTARTEYYLFQLQVRDLRSWSSCDCEWIICVHYAFIKCVSISLLLVVENENIDPRKAEGKAGRATLCGIGRENIYISHRL